MKVVSFMTATDKMRYMLVGENGNPVVSVLKYIRFKDQNGSARNTLRAICYQLKLFFEFLEENQLDFSVVSIDDLAAFKHFLQYGSKKVTPIGQNIVLRKARTVNVNINTVLNFYVYLIRKGDYKGSMPLMVYRSMPSFRRGFKGFLHHVNKGRSIKSNIFRTPEPKERPKVLSRDQVSVLLGACRNVRDHFLVQLLWESGMRIGELLSLWLEDFEIDGRRIHIRDRGELENLAEIKTVHSPRSIDVSSDLINLFLDYVSQCHDDDVDTNHVFIKLAGKAKGRPLEYTDVAALFKELRNRTSIYVTPHMLRHSSLTELRRAGWSVERLMKRAGHKNPETTIQLYLHPSDEEMREDWEKAEHRMKVTAKRGVQSNG